MLFLAFGSDFFAAQMAAKKYLREKVSEIATFHADICIGSPEKLAAELAQEATLFSGTRGILIEGATDRHTKTLVPLLKGARAICAVVAGSLETKSSLRKGLEEYPSQEFRIPTRRILSDYIQESLKQTPPNAEIRDNIIDRLPHDTGVAKAWLKTLASFCQIEGQCTLREVDLVIPDDKQSEMYAIIDAVMDRNAKTTLQMLLKLENNKGIALLRAAQRSFQRLHQARALVDAGMRADQAFSQLKPPVPVFARASTNARLVKWRSAQIEAALGRLTRAEAGIKKGLPSGIETEAALLSIAQSK